MSKNSKNKTSYRVNEYTTMISVRLPNELYAKIEARAVKKKTKVSKVVIEILEQGT